MRSNQLSYPAILAFAVAKVRIIFIPPKENSTFFHFIFKEPFKKHFVQSDSILFSLSTVKFNPLVGATEKSLL